LEIKLPFIFPPKTNKCHGNSTVWAHVANLAVLTAFFKSEDLGSLAGASVVEHQLELHLPKFSTFSREYQDFVAHDHTLHMTYKNLRRVLRTARQFIMG